MKAGSSLPVSQETTCGVRFTLISPQMIFHSKTFPLSESMRRYRCLFCTCASALSFPPQRRFISSRLLELGELSRTIIRHWIGSYLLSPRELWPADVRDERSNARKIKASSRSSLSADLSASSRVQTTNQTTRPLCVALLRIAVSPALHVRCMTARPIKRPMNDS